VDAVRVSPSTALPEIVGGEPFTGGDSFLWGPYPFDGETLAEPRNPTDLCRI
jgi:hypothetical protein